MCETWLLPNRRLFWFAVVVPAVVVAVGLALVAKNLARPWGAILLVFGLASVAILYWQMMVPRLARRGGDLLVYLKAGRPLRLPVEFAECFFLSSGAGQITTARGVLPMRNLVLRVAERAAEYQSVAGTTTYGCWADGYICFYGKWCEPLDLELVQRLNAKLKLAREPAP